MSTAPSRNIDIELRAPHPAQVEILRDAKRFNVLACGRRFGKSVLGVEQIAITAIEGKPAGYFCPTHKMLTEVWRDALEILTPLISRKQEQVHRLELITGGVVDMWSLDAKDTSRGRKYARIVVDEAAMVPDLVNVWDAVLRPTLADLKGDAWFPSTPRGLNGFHTLFERGIADDPEWASWQMPTSANPYIDPDEIEAARAGTPSDLFAQEYLAEFISTAGAVFRNIPACLNAKPAKPAAHIGHKLVMGVDWAQKHDFTVFSVGCADCACELEIDRFNQIEWAIQRGRLTAMAKRWGVVDILAESNSIGSPNIEALANEGLPIRAFETTASSKGPLIQSLALAFERAEWQWQPDAVGKHELLAYEATVSRVTGRVSYSAPEGGHDDTVIARALCHRAATERQPEFGVTVL